MKWFLMTLLLFLIGCSGLPTKMRGNNYSRLNLSTVKTNILAYQHQAFRWGGTVIKVLNKKNSSQIQLLYYPVSRYGRPLIEQKTEGRFAITSPLFLDPAIYKEGTEITVTGILSGEIKQKIGKKILTLPLLTVNNIHIWPDRQRIDEQAYPYSPYALPYYPYHRWGNCYY